MRIKKIHIKYFKSIIDSREVTIDKNITTLLGKNESGKTCILKALESIYEDYNEDDLSLHSDVREKIISGEINVDEINIGEIDIITIWFEIEKVDKRKLKELNPKLEKIKTLKVTKFLDGLFYIESPEITISDLKINSESINNKIEENLSKIKELTNSFNKQLEEHYKRFSPFNQSKPQVDKLINEIISYSPENKKDIDKIFKNFEVRLKNLPRLDSHIIKDIDSYFNEIKDYINEIKNFILENIDITDEIMSILPNIVYFSDIEKLEDTILISEFLSNRENHKTLSNLIKLSGIDIEKITDSNDYDRLSNLHTGSTIITGMVNESWKQEEVQVKIEIVNEKIVISILDNIIKRHHPPSIRSQGFQWFLSFYINFMAGSKGELKNTILLLDDPGVYLHPSGQKDLLDTFEKISETNQIIFSTHSPFMIDRKKLNRIRIVSKIKPEGTIINEKFYHSDFDALQPIRASIGMTIGDSLFTTKKTIFTEGYSDKIILEAMSNVCLSKNKDYIDLSKFSILSVNGADKMHFFVLIHITENLKYIIILDDDPEGRKTKKELIEKFNINNIISLKDFSNIGNDIEIEDIIDIDFYLNAVNIAYKDIFKKKLEKESIKKEELDEVSFSGIKKYFKEKGIGRSRKIDKVKVANKIYHLISNNAFPSDKTINIFSKLFKAINSKT